MGNLVAWRRGKSEILEYENIHTLHLDSNSINKVSAYRLDYSPSFHVYVQVKSGYIYKFNFKEASGFLKTKDDIIRCGTFTFCRMDMIKIFKEDKDEEVLLSYPSASIENAINILKIKKNEDCTYLIKDFMIQNFGMCLFTKMKQLRDSRILLICGYESGKLIVLNCESEAIIYNETCFDQGDSCTDADMHETIDGSIVIVVVSTGKNVKIIRNFDTSALSSLILPFPGCNSVSIRPDGKLFVTGGWDCKLRFFSLKSLKLLAVLDYHFDSINDVKISEENILAASSDGTISVWTLFQ